MDHLRARRMLACKIWYQEDCYTFSADISATEHPHYDLYRTALREVCDAKRRKSRELTTPLVQIGQWYSAGDRSPTLSRHWSKGEKRCWAAELRPGFFVYFMHNGDLLRTYKPPTSMPGGVKHSMMGDKEDEWNDYCLYCSRPCTKYDLANFVCCESCPSICCPGCIATIEPHARVAVSEGGDWHCGPCRHKYEACADGCHACQLELASTKTPGTRFFLYCKTVGWTAATVLQHLPAGVPDQYGVVSSKDYTEVRLNRKPVWVELTTAGCGYSEDKPDVPKGVPTGGWKLA